VGYAIGRAGTIIVTCDGGLHRIIQYDNFPIAMSETGKNLEEGEQLPDRIFSD